MISDLRIKAVKVSFQGGFFTYYLLVNKGHKWEKVWEKVIRTGMGGMKVLIDPVRGDVYPCKPGTYWGCKSTLKPKSWEERRIRISRISQSDLNYLLTYSQ